MVARPAAGRRGCRLAEAAQEVGGLALAGIELERAAERSAGVGAVAGGEQRLAEGEIACRVPRILVDIFLEQRDRALRLALLERLNVRLSSRAGNSGRLFGAVTVADVATAVSKAGGPSLDKRKIEIPNPIKTVGSHKVSVRLHADVAATIGLTITAA